MGWAWSMIARDEKCVLILIGKPEGERPLRRPWRRWEDDIKIYFRETGSEIVD
jgi:hypothetical protein